MQKFLRTLTLMALLFTPWVMQGQNANVSEYDMSYSTAAYSSVATAGGNLLSFTNGEADVTMPFAMYFGTEQITNGSTLKVKADGSVSFASIDGSYIAPLRYTADYVGGNVYALSTGSKLTIEWRKVTQGGENSYSFQLCLYPNGNIEFRYGPMTLGSPISVLVGMRSVATDYFRLRGEGGTSYWNTMERVVNDATTRTLSTAYHPDYDLATNTGVVYTFVKPACVKPVQGNITNVAWDRVTINWNENTRDGYQVAYSTDPEINFATAAASEYTVVSGTIAGTATSKEVTGLDPLTTYYFAVRGNCGGIWSAWSNVKSATTANSCPAPAASNYSLTNAGVASWTMTSFPNITSIDIYYSTENVAPDANTTPSKANVAVSTANVNLGAEPAIAATSATTWYVWFRAHCTVAGGTTTDWVSKGNFTTPCGAFIVTRENPLVEDFESTIFPPVCWSTEHTAGTATTLWQRQTSPVHTGSGSAKLPDQQTGNKTNLVTPQLNIATANGYRVSFWMYRVSGSKPNEGVKVWVNTTPDTIGGTALMHIRRAYQMGEITETAQGWYKYTATIPTSGNVYIIFEGISEYGNYSSIDDVVVEPLPTCPEPLAPEATADGVVTWAASNNASSYDLQWGLPGFDPDENEGTTVTLGNVLTHTLTGLSSATVYDVYLRAHCSATNEVTEWIGPATFTTACVAMNLPYNENFTNYTVANSYPYNGPAAIPLCWDYISNGTNTEATTTSAYYGGVKYYSGTSYGSMEAYNNYLCMPIYVIGANTTSATYVNYHNQRGDTKYAVLPLFTQPLSTMQISFQYKIQTANSTTGQNTALELGYITNDDVATFQTLETYPGTTATVQTVSEMSLATLAASAPAGARLAFKYSGTHNGTATTSGGQNYCGIDNIVVEAIPTCPKPTNLVATPAIDANSVTSELSWSENGSATQWEVRYWVAGTTDTFSVVAGANPYTLNTLNLGTAYEWQVRSLCSANDNSDWSVNGSFMTASCYDFGEPGAPTTVTIGSGTATNQYLPGYSFYNYSYTQQIYTPNEIGTAGSISSIAFNNGGAEKTRSYKVYLTHTDKNTFSSGTDWVAISESDKVYEGTLTFTAGEWTTINFSTPFNYDGASNLLVSVADVTGSYSSSPHMTALVFDATSQAIRAYRDTPGAYDITAPGVTGTVLNVKNQIVLGLQPLECLQGNCLAPTVAIEVSQADYEATLTFTDNNGEANPVFGYKYGVRGFNPATATEYTTTTGTATITGLSPLTDYDVYVYAKCAGVAGRMVPYRFTTPFIPNCKEQQNFVASNVTYNTATVTWEQKDPAQVPEFWTVRWSDVDFDPATAPAADYTEVNILGTAGPTLNLTGLAAGNTYYIYVKATCDQVQGDVSPNWSSFDFETPTCVTPTNFVATNVTNSTAVLSWDNATGIEGWTLRYGPDQTFAPGTYTDITLTTNSKKLEGLAANATLYATVKANCTATDESNWANVISIKTTCPGYGDNPAPEEEVVIGDGTGTNSYVPAYSLYDYSYTQQLYTAEEIGGTGLINNIAFDIVGVKERNVEIYLVETDKTSFASGNDWVPVTASDKVYTGSIGAQAGWNTIELATPFEYSGNGSLVVVVNNINGSWSSGLSSHVSTATNTVLYSYRDGTIYNINNIPSGTQSSSRSNLKVGIQFMECDVTTTCFAPTNVTVACDSSNHVTVTWAARTDLEPLVEDFDINYGVKGFNPNAATQNFVHVGDVYTYTFNALPEMEYDFYVRTHCSDNDQSAWTKASFTSYPTVFAPTQLHATGKTDTSVALAWTEVNPTPATAWQVVYGQPGFNPEDATNIMNAASTAASITGLHHTTNYDFYVRAVKGAEHSPWSQVCTATTDCGVWVLEDLPLVEDFAEVNSSNVPNCWTPAGGNVYTNISGNYINIYSEGGMVILPEMDLNFDTLVVSFEAANYSSGANHNFQVGYLSSKTDTTTFHAMQTINLTTNEYNEYQVSFADMPAADIQTARYVAFRGLASADFNLKNVVVKKREKTNRMSDLGGEYAICNEYVMPAVNATTGNYNGNVNATYVIRPAQAGKVVKLSGNYDLEYGYDFVYVYEGEGANKTIIDTLTGKGSYEYMTSSNDWVNNGVITLVYRTDADNSLTLEGFKFLAQCECPMPAADTIVTSHEANGTYVWNGIERDNSDVPYEAAPDKNEVLEYTVLNVGGCDSVYLRDTMTLHPTYLLNFSDEICERDTFNFFGQQYTTQGTHTVTLQSVYGADSVGVLALTVHTAPTAGIYYNGNKVTTVNDFCDNADMLLNARSNVTTATFVWDDNSTDANRTVNPHESNTYTVVATEPVFNCTSLPATVTVTTTPVPALTISGENAICYGQSTTLTVTDANALDANYVWKSGTTNVGTGATLTVSPTETTTYTVTATTNNASACAITAEYTVTVNPLPVIATPTASVSELCLNESVTLNAQVVDGYTYEWSTGATTAEATTVPTATGAYTVTVTDLNGCVNEFTTASVTVHPSYELNEERSACIGMLPYTWGAQTLTAAGNYDQTFTIAHGCDSLVHLTFVVEDTAVNNATRVLCEGAAFTFGEGIYEQAYTATTSTVLTYIDTTSGECPARFNLNLTVNTHNPATVENTVCDTYTWPLNNETYTVSGAYQTMLQTTKGCDSLVTLNLTVNYQNTGVEEVATTCDSYTWVLNGVTYTEPTNEPTFTLQNQWGCDSVVTLNLAEVKHSTEGVDNITYCDDFTYTWINGVTYDLSETAGNIRYTLPTPNAQGCDTTAILHLVMNPVHDTMLWKDTMACDELVINTVTCESMPEQTSIRNSGDYQLRVHNAANNRDEIMQLHVTINTSTPITTIDEGCLPYTWNLTLGDNSQWQFIVKEEDHVGEDLIYITKEIAASTNGCSQLAVLRLTAHHPVVETVEHVMCENTSWDTLGTTYSGATMVANDDFEYDVPRALTDEGCDSVLHLVFNVLETADVTVYDTIVEGRFEYNEESGYYEYAWISQTNAEDTLILTIDDRYTQDPQDGTKTAIWQRENGCDSNVTVVYHVIPTLYSYEPDTVVCSEFVWERDNQVVGIATLEEAKENGGYVELYDTLMSVQYGYDSLIVMPVYFWYPDTTWKPVTDVCTEYEWEGVTYWTDSTFFVQAGPNVNGCDSVVAYSFHVIGDRMYDFNVVTNEPYQWYYDNVDTIYTQSTQKYVDWTTDGCNQVLHLTLTILDGENNYCVSDTNVATIPVTNEEFVPNQLAPGHYYSEMTNGDFIDVINNAPYIFNDTIIYVNIRPVYDQMFDTVVCDLFEWNGQQITETGIYTQLLPTDVYSCDSLVTYNVWVNPSVAEATDSVVTVCDEFHFMYSVDYAPAANDSMSTTLSFHFEYDSIFTESTQYTIMLKNEHFCDSIVNLNLTVNKNTPVVDSNVSVCDSYVWIVNNNAANDTLNTYTVSGEYGIEVTDANGCVATDSLYLTVNYQQTAPVWDTFINAPSYMFNASILDTLNSNYQNRFFQAPTDTTFDEVLIVKTAAGCDSIAPVHIVVNAGDVVTDNITACGRYTWTENGHGTGHTYQWISAAERAANGNALYKDITANVYIHNGENPKDSVFNAQGQLISTYVLWLNLAEAYITDSTIARYPISMGNTLNFFEGNDSLMAVNYTIPVDLRPTFENPSVTIDTTLALEYKTSYIENTGNYYCGAIYDLHMTAVYNYDTLAAQTVCHEVDSIEWDGRMIALTDGDNLLDSIYNEGTLNEQLTHRVVTRKTFVGGTIADSTVCEQLVWGDSTYLVSTTDAVAIFAAVDGCDSVMTITNLTINNAVHQSLAVTGCDSAFWADKGAAGTWYYTNTVDTVMYLDINGCQVVDTMHVTVVPTVHQVVLDTTVCDTYTWHETDYIASGSYPYDYTTTTNAVVCNHADTLKLTVNYSAVTYPDSLVFGENFRMDGQLYSAPYDDVVVRNLQTVAGCDSTANVHLVVSFYTEVNVTKEACGIYEWIAADNGNGHTYRSISDEEAIANGNALYYDVTDSAYVTSNPSYAPASGQPNYGNRYHLQLTLNGAVYHEKDTNYLLSKGDVMTYNAENYDFAALIAAKTGKDTTYLVHFGAQGTACDSIETLNVHVVYNFTHTDTAVCAENGDQFSWRNNTWTIGAAGSTVTLYDTAAKGTENEWVYTHEVFRRAAIATTASDVDECDEYVWGGETFTHDTTNVAKTFVAVNGCDSVVTVPVITIRHRTQNDSTKVVCDSWFWNDSTYAVSTVDTVIKVNSVGCDSLDILHLTINKNPGSMTVVNACDSYIWPVNNTEYTEGGQKFHDTIDANGCHAFDTLVLVVNASSHVLDTEYVSEGSIRFNGRLYVAPAEFTRYDTTWTDDNHTEFVPNAVGCYNITDVTVKVGSFYHRDEMYVKCNSFTWPVNGHTYNWISADERAAHGNALYYDATDQEYVLTNPTVNIPNEGDYDSIIMLMLTLTQNTSSNDEVTFPVSLVTLTYGDSIFDYSTQRDQALNGGDFAGYEDVRDVHFASVEYCDSVVTVSIHVVNNYTHVGDTDICVTQNSVTWRDHTINTTTNDYDNLHYYYIYDTVGTAEAPVVEYMKVAQHPVVYAVERRTACDSYEWNDEVFTESTTNYTKIFEGGSQFGCDSTVILHLTVNYNSSTLTETTECDSYTWTAQDGFSRTYTQSIDTVYHYNTVEGCPSADTLRLTINYKQTNVLNEVACDSYSFIDTIFTTDTTGYVRVLNDVNGCDSTVTLNLTVNYSTQRLDTIKVTTYQSYTATSGTVYYLTGIYEDVITNVAGCDSIEVLDLTISHGAMTSYSVICDSVEWHDSTYATAGTFFFDYNNSDVRDTLVIGEVRYATHDVYYDTACQNYTWTFATAVYDYAGDSVEYMTTDTRYYTAGGVKTNYYINTVGCESVDTLHLVIGAGRTFAEDVVTACGSFDWYVNDSLIGTFTENIETQTSFVNPATKCDSVTFLKLTIVYAPVTDTAATICESELPYTWRDITLTEAGTAEVTFPLDNGCDSTRRFTLTVLPTVTFAFDAVACDSYTWNNETYTESGVYTQTLTSTEYGCDSVVTFTLTINANSSTEYTETVCDSYMWNNTQYTESGDYTYDYTDENGCASTDVLHLTVYTSAINTIEMTVCDSYKWENATDETYTASGVYSYDYSTTDGCNGTTYLVLTVNNSTSGNETATACDSYTWNGETYTESGDYTFNTTNAVGCDSTATLTLTINTSNTGVDVQTACETYTWIDNNVYTASNNTATYTLTNAAGCDSVVTLNLTINNSVATSFADEACNAYVWEGSYYTESGAYTKTFEAANGCDSVVTLMLTINQPVAETITETACGSYTWNGITYNASGNYTQTDVAANGCDSVTTLVLTINQPVTGAFTDEACESYTWNGETYTESGAYTQTFTAANGCDSVVTLTLTINAPANTTEDVTACESYTWHGQVYTTNGAYTYNFTDNNGCAAVATLNLTINTPANTTETVTACNSYSWNNQTYTNSGVYTSTFVDANGCNATATLSLTINNPVNATFTVTECESYTWHGQVYTVSGNYTYTTTAANGCDSIETLVLTINQPTTATEYAEACGSYTWNGTTYTQPGAYPYTTTGSNGCDSTVTLLLNLVQPVQTIINQTACDSYTWNGTTYTTSGSYSVTFTAANNCDSVVTLNLTVNNSVSNSLTATACESYTWNGQTYATSGSYTQVFTAHNGCDSTVTLALTINTPTTATVTETACSSFDWNGETYTTSGSYTYTTTGANGCDSVTTLLLTINLPVYTNLEANAEGSYSWNGETYTESGVYTYTTTAANGCDSVVTLTLTITPVYTVTLVSQNEAWGSVSESGTIAENGYFTATATANEGYEFVAWLNGNDTVSTSSTYIFQVTEDITLTAVFAEVQGISAVDMNNVVIYSTDSRIFVNGAEGYDVYVYDVNGRVINRQMKAADAIEFRMTTTGVYLVKVGNAPAKRVVVVR